MHQRRLDKIQSDKNRAQDEENRRIAVSTMTRSVTCENQSDDLGN